MFGLKKGKTLITKKFIFFGYIEKQDSLIRGWLGWEMWTLVLLCLSSLICIADPTNWAIIAWILVYIIVTVSISIVGICKTIGFYKISKKSNDLISQHKDPYLRKVFRNSPRYLKMIIILDFFYPVLWIFSFIIKLLFAMNAQKMKNLITISSES